MRRSSVLMVNPLVASAVALCLSGCGGTASLFNPAFLNTFMGGQVPVTPGPGAAFVFVRCINETDQVVKFLVVAERAIPELDEDGNYRIEDGEFVMRIEREGAEVCTVPNSQGREAGVVYSCSQSPIVRVGLGENLLTTDPAVAVGGDCSGGAEGFGVVAGDLTPLTLEEFSCGDTIIFRAFESITVAGGVALQSYLLPGSQQPSDFSGPDTFVNLENFIESQVSEDEP